MRKLIITVALVCLLWSGWWWAASSALQQATAGWFTARTAEGWQAEYSGLSGGGFPFDLQAGLTDIAVADPRAGLALRTHRLDITAPAHWPGDVTVTLDEGPIQIATPQGRSVLVMQNGVMALNLKPGTALELEALGWTAQAWRIEDTAGARLEADTLTLTMTQVEGPTYAFAAKADALAPGAATRARLRLPDTFPRTFDSIVARATVTFDRPWDRRVLNEARPQPRKIALHLAEARWGDLSFNLAANLNVNSAGIPDGTLSLQAENWRTILDFVQASGRITPALRGQAERLLQVLAQASGNPATLDVDLTLRDGAVFLGFLPIAAAPRILLR